MRDRTAAALAPPPIRVRGKKSQPTIHEQPSSEYGWSGRAHRTVDGDHGRIETRTIRDSSEIDRDLPVPWLDFPEACFAAQVTRELVYRRTGREEQALTRERALATVSGAIGAIALVLAGIGVFSLASYTVRNEKRAIGVRMAVGADRWRVLSWVLSRTVWVSLAGVAVGSPLAIFIGRYLQSVLFGVPSMDLWTLVGGGTILAAVSLVAALFPALQASFIQPMSVLREE